MSVGLYTTRGVTTTQMVNGKNLSTRLRPMKIFGTLERYGLWEAEEMPEQDSMLWASQRQMPDHRDPPTVVMIMLRGHEACHH